MHIKYALLNVVKLDQIVITELEKYSAIFLKVSTVEHHEEVGFDGRFSRFNKRNLCRFLALLVVSAHRNAIAHYQDSKGEGLAWRQLFRRRYLKGRQIVRSGSNIKSKLLFWMSNKCYLSCISLLVRHIAVCCLLRRWHNGNSRSSRDDLLWWWRQSLTAELRRSRGGGGGRRRLSVGTCSKNKRSPVSVEASWQHFWTCLLIYCCFVRRASSTRAASKRRSMV